MHIPFIKIGCGLFQSVHMREYSTAASKATPHQRLRRRRVRLTSTAVGSSVAGGGAWNEARRDRMPEAPQALAEVGAALCGGDCRARQTSSPHTSPPPWLNTTTPALHHLFNGHFPVKHCFLYWPYRSPGRLSLLLLLKPCPPKVGLGLN